MKSLFKRATIYLFLPLVLMSMLYAVDASDIQLTDSQADIIAQKVWQNEANGNLKYLIHWNKNETFLSLGIAHFLWYAETNRAGYQEMFPLLVDYFKKHNVRLPDWLNGQTVCPWENRHDFMQAKERKTPKYRELYNLLVCTMPIQVNFIIERLQQALPKILESLEPIKDAERRKKIVKAYYRVLTPRDNKFSTNGIYIILDYVNFKGEGTSVKERYQGEGWGLRQVLEEMNPETKDAYQAFADAAKRVLIRRIENAPPQQNEIRWRKGWFQRIDSYSN